MQDIKRSAFLSAIVGLAVAAANPVRAQDVNHGKSVFMACAACHATDRSNQTGPGLQGIVGRTAGKAAGFHFSHAMQASGIIWSAKALDAYLADPQKAVPGNRMPYAGLKDAQDRAALIAYLATLK